ncbi:dipeptidase 2-like protein [Gorgonomyces haynaldii]|nr:dipeptidase 2-like protein [Gorgonomyces haynaldii]
MIHLFWIPLLLFLGYQYYRTLKPEDPLERAIWMTKKHVLLDTHNDLPFKLLASEGGKIDHLDLRNLSSNFNTDLHRMQKGGMGAQVWSGYIPCDPQFVSGQEVRLSLEMIDLIKRIIKQYPQYLEYAETAKDIVNIKRKQKIASLIGFEGGHQMDGSLSALRMYYDLGVRYMTLTHGCHTSWADSATQFPPVHNGLTDFGRQVVQEMNRLGMMVDLSHVTHKTMRDVIEVTRAPLFFSHSSAHALCPKERNAPDDVLLKMKELDGVIMINFWPALISCQETATLSQVADHIEHIKNLVGAEHIGFGADFDGAPTSEGLEDVSKYPQLLSELYKRGFTDQEIVGIMGGNFVRVLRKTEEQAHQTKLVENNERFNRTCV